MNRWSQLFGLNPFSFTSVSRIFAACVHDRNQDSVVIATIISFHKKYILYTIRSCSITQFCIHQIFSGWYANDHDASLNMQMSSGDAAGYDGPPGVPTPTQEADTGSAVFIAHHTAECSVSHSRASSWHTGRWSSRLSLVSGPGACCRSRFKLRRAVTKMQVSAAGDVRRCGDPVLQINAGRAVKRPSRIASAIRRLLPAPVTQTVEAVRASGSHVYGGNSGDSDVSRNKQRVLFNGRAHETFRNCKNSQFWRCPPAYSRVSLSKQLQLGI